MYNSIQYTTLHILPGHEGETHTLSKTSAVYSNDRFEFINDNFFESSKEIKANIREFGKEIVGEDAALYPHFMWHLN